LKENHPSIAISYNNLATWYQQINDTTNAFKYFKLVVDNFEGSENQLTIAQSSFNLGQLYLKNNDFFNSRNMTQQALEIWENMFNPEHPNIQTAKLIIEVLDNKLK